MKKIKIDFTPEHLNDMLNSRNPDYREWHAAMEAIFPKYDITNKKRIAGFVSQCGHESQNFLRLEENLNYSVEALLRVFPRYFRVGNGRNPHDYARNPQRLANYVYMDQYRTPRGALGNVNEGDGWLFRGRGLKQLTGRNNYAAFGRSVGMSAEKAVEYVLTKQGAIESACWFWDNANCNRVADTGDVKALTQRINGGTIGMRDRKRRWKLALEVLSGNKKYINTDISNLKIVRLGDRGSTVKVLQEGLGINADGIFGPMTDRALRRFQSENGLVVDGIAGPRTFRALLEK